MNSEEVGAIGQVLGSVAIRHYCNHPGFTPFWARWSYLYPAAVRELVAKNIDSVLAQP